MVGQYSQSIHVSIRVTMVGQYSQSIRVNVTIVGQYSQSIRVSVGELKHARMGEFT